MSNLANTLFWNQLAQRRQDAAARQEQDTAQQDRAAEIAARQEAQNHERAMRGLDLASKKAQLAAQLGKARLQFQNDAQQEMGDLGYDTGMLGEQKAEQARSAEAQARADKAALARYLRLEQGRSALEKQGAADAAAMARTKAEQRGANYRTKYATDNRKFAPRAGTDPNSIKNPVVALETQLFGMAKQLGASIMPDHRPIAEAAWRAAAALNNARTEGRPPTAEEWAQAQQIWGNVEAAMAQTGATSSAPVAPAEAPVADSSLSPEEAAAAAEIERALNE